MTKTEAHRILDAAKNGVAISLSLITQALIVTGDITHRFGGKE